MPSSIHFLASLPGHEKYDILTQACAATSTHKYSTEYVSHAIAGVSISTWTRLGASSHASTEVGKNNSTTHAYNTSLTSLFAAKVRITSSGEVNTNTLSHAGTSSPHIPARLSGHGPPQNTSNDIYGTDREQLPADIANDCLLWDGSCSGNRTAATTDFFETGQYALQMSPCFSNQTQDNQTLNCSPKVLKEAEKK